MQGDKTGIKASVWLGYGGLEETLALGKYHQFWLLGLAMHAQN